MHTGDKCAKKKTNTDIARLVMTIHVHCFHHNHHLRKKKKGNIRVSTVTNYPPK